MSIVNARNAVIKKLEELVSSRVLGEVNDKQFNIDVLKNQPEYYPSAWVSSPSFSNSEADNTANERDFVFIVTVITQDTDEADFRENDVLKEVIANAFDTDFTLDGGVTYVNPVASSTEPLKTVNNSFFVFTLEITVRMLIDIVE